MRVVSVKFEQSIPNNPHAPIHSVTVNFVQIFHEKYIFFAFLPKPTKDPIKTKTKAKNETYRS